MILAYIAFNVKVLGYRKKYLAVQKKKCCKVKILAQNKKE